MKINRDKYIITSLTQASNSNTLQVPAVTLWDYYQNRGLKVTAILEDNAYFPTYNVWLPNNTCITFPAELYVATWELESDFMEVHPNFPGIDSGDSE